ncbi:GDSL-type esterase/lipase family protein [Microbacterium sp. ASV49]|uniref:GDSL-type esterase/lipase family protein n=1 Tax=Microbacterium candidum TaxID=3041922 RepID=A0ABT7MV51_9MICO|nr:GDSL-type esterase/lipase family protein [Microbacterium sp. ASV49]MDL9978329.1 GDSL-type esterase/lipase family protein [Microbacterium sp. ASV49]
MENSAKPDVVMRNLFHRPSDGDRLRPAPTRRRILVDALVIVLVAAASITLSLWLTPMQEVSTAGQTVAVGVTEPTWSLSGPGQLDLFGQSLPTTIQFDGPIRPRLTLSRITLSEQLTQFAAGKDAAATLEDALIGGWERFFIWQAVIVALTALLLAGAAAGWLRRGWRGTGILLAGSLVLALGVDLGGVMVTAYSAPAKLARIGSLQDLVGGAPAPVLRPVPTNPADVVQRVVVVGDSTAAGLGNQPLPKGTEEDKACGRSRDAFAVDLALVNGWTVTNLACSGATIREGLLDSQSVGDRTIPAQLKDPEVAKAQVVIVSIGANDVQWTSMLELCAISASCSDNAEQAFFQQQLATFSSDYLQLLDQLQLLPSHPAVVINLYYDPVPGSVDCLKQQHITPDKQASLQADLAALNMILGRGAKAADFAVAAPDFTGHGVCTSFPYVQGVNGAAPFHPTSSGQLAIALAVEHALRLR